MVVVRFPDVDVDGESNMLLISVLDWAFILVRSVMKGRIWKDPRRSRKLEEPQLELQFKKLMFKSPSNTIDFSSLFALERERDSMC